MKKKPDFVQLIEKHVYEQNEENKSEVLEEKKDKPIRKIQVKALKGSPYVISLDEADVVGQGSFGKVVRAYDMQNRNEDLVAKIICLSDEAKEESMQTELKVLVKLPLHANLVNYKKIKLSSQKRQYFIMDFCNGGTLTQYLKNQKKLSESDIIDFLQQFCRGYRVLFHSGIIHRDIKPDNILLHNRVFKIADFGLAKIVDSLQVQNISTRGTPLYIAPELVKKELASAKVDMWSLGVILYRMLFEGRYPFLDPAIKYDVPTALKHIQQKKLIIPPSPKRSVEIIELLRRMLEKEESKRIGWDELFEHPLILPSLQKEDRGDKEDEEVNTNKKMLKSSMFLQKIEVIRQSKIQMTSLEKKFNKQVKTSDADSEIYSKNEEKIDSEIFDKKRKTSEEIKMTIQAIIAQSKKRLKANISIIHVEDILLKCREKVLFLDNVCLRMSVMNKLIGKYLSEDEYKEYSILNQKGVLLLLQMAIIFNNQLQNFDPQQCNTILKEDWDEFLMSDNLLILNSLLKQDKNCLIEFQKDFIQERELIPFEKSSYQLLVAGLDMERLLKEINSVLYPLLKLFGLIYEKTVDIKRGLLILFIYIDLACSINRESSVFNSFVSYQDYLAYYEDIEQNETELNLYNQLMQNINQI